MALPEPAPAPANADDQEHTATVCIPCPKCGEVIRSMKVKQKGRRETATISAECPKCKWQDEADEPMESLGMTSLALPQPLPTAYAPPRVSAPTDLDAPIFPSAPAAAHFSDNGDLHVDPDVEIPEDEFETACIAESDRMTASAPSLAYERPSNGGATKRLQRSRREAWLLTSLCFVALAAGGLELTGLVTRLSIWETVLLAGLLLPATTVLLIHGLRGLWRTTIY